MLRSSTSSHSDDARTYRQHRAGRCACRFPDGGRSAPVGVGTAFIEDLASDGCECRLPIARAKWTEMHHQQWDDLNALAKRLDAILIAGAYRRGSRFGNFRSGDSSRS